VPKESASIVNLVVGDIT